MHGMSADDEIVYLRERAKRAERALAAAPGRIAELEAALLEACGIARVWAEDDTPAGDRIAELRLIAKGSGADE